MAQKKQDKKAKPHFRTNPKSFFYDRQIYFPRFPTIYQLDFPKEYKYTKLYDVLFEFYFEMFRERDEQPIIGREEIFLYSYLQSLANRGKGFNQKTLAKFIQIDPHNLVKRLDRLEDALLIHRVQRLDLHGLPNDLIVHSIPKFHLKDKKFSWNKPLLDKIQKRVKTEETRLTRKESGILKDDGETERLFIPRTKQKFAFDYKKVFLETFEDDEAASQNFAESILISFCHDKDLIMQDAKSYDKILRQRVFESFADSALQPTEKHYHAALTLRRIYAPVLSEF